MAGSTGVARANPLRVVKAATPSATGATCTARAARPSAWASAEDYFRYRARLSPLSTWSATRATTSRSPMRSGRSSTSSPRRSTSPAQFVCLPGYEWSGNTGMGGDRNVFYRREGRPIRRSSHILVEGQTSTDAIYTADKLFECAERRGRHRDRPCRRPLRRPEIRPRRPARARGRGAFVLGHVRMDAARCFREGLSRRRGLPQRRPQGTAGRDAARRIDLRRDWRFDLLLHAGADARCSVCGAAPTASLRNHRQPAVPRPARQRSPPTSSAFPTIRCSVPSTEQTTREVRMGDIVRPGPVPMQLDRRGDRHRAGRALRRAARNQTSSNACGPIRRPISAAACACSGRAPSIAAAAARPIWQGKLTLTGNRFSRFAEVNFLNPERKVQETVIGHRARLDVRHDRQPRWHRPLAR